MTRYSKDNQDEYLEEMDEFFNRNEDDTENDATAEKSVEDTSTEDDLNDDEPEKKRKGFIKNTKKKVEKFKKEKIEPNLIRPNEEKNQNSAKAKEKVKKEKDDYMREQRHRPNLLEEMKFAFHQYANSMKQSFNPYSLDRTYYNVQLSKGVEKIGEGLKRFNEFRKNLAPTFETNELMYGAEKGVENIDTLKEAKDALFEGYDVKFPHDINEDTIKAYDTFEFSNLPTEESLQYLKEHGELKAQYKRNLKSEGKSSADIDTKMSNELGDYTLEESININNILEAQKILDEKGISFKELIKYCHDGSDQANPILNNAYQLSPDYINEFIDKNNIERSTIIDNGEEGFVRDSDKKQNDVPASFVKIPTVEQLNPFIENAINSRPDNLIDLLPGANKRYKVKVDTFGRFEEPRKVKKTEIEQLTTHFLPNLKEDEYEKMGYFISGKDIIEGYVSTNDEKSIRITLTNEAEQQKFGETIELGKDQQILCAENLTEALQLAEIQQATSDQIMYQQTGGYMSLIIEDANKDGSSVHPLKKDLLESATQHYIYDEPFGKDSEAHQLQVENDRYLLEAERSEQKKPKNEPTHTLENTSPANENDLDLDNGPEL